MTERQVPLEVAELRAIPEGALVRAVVRHSPGEASPGAYEIKGPLRLGRNGTDILLGHELITFVPDHLMRRTHCKTCLCVEAQVRDEDFVINPAIKSLSLIEEVESP